MQISGSPEYWSGDEDSLESEPEDKEDDREEEGDEDKSEEDSSEGFLRRWSYQELRPLVAGGLSPLSDSDHDLGMTDLLSLIVQNEVGQNSRDQTIFNVYLDREGKGGRNKDSIIILWYKVIILHLHNSPVYKCNVQRLDICTTYDKSVRRHIWESGDICGVVKC